MKKQSIFFIIVGFFALEKIHASCDSDYFTSEGDVVLESLSAAAADAGIIIKAKGQTIDLIGMLVHILGFSRLHPVEDDTAGTGKFVNTPAFSRLGRSNINYNGNTVRLEINRDQEDVGSTTNPLELEAVSASFVITGGAGGIGRVKIGDGNVITATNGGDVFTVEWLSNGVVLLTAIT